MHLPDLRATMDDAERLARLPVHQCDDFSQLRRRDPRGAEEVHRGIGGRSVARSLRADHDDGPGEVAQHERERRRREVQRVRAVRDDDAGRTFVEFLRGLSREALPVLRFQVLAENAKDHTRAHVADIEELGDGGDQFLSGHRRMHRSRPVVDIGGDRPAGPEDRDRRPVFRRWREVPFDRRGRVLALHFDGLDVSDRDADVVSARQLDRHDVLAAESVMGHENALVRFPLRSDGDAVPLVCPGTVEHTPDARRVVHPPSQPIHLIWSLCREDEEPSRQLPPVTPTAREVLNELRWRTPGQLAGALLWYRDRRRPGGVRQILGSEITDLERRYFTTAKGRLPYYKIDRIDLGTNVVFERNSSVQLAGRPRTRSRQE